MSQKQPILIDVREPAEFAQAHATGAINITLDQVLQADTPLANLPLDARIIVYCRSGARADVAQKHLRQLGYTNVINGINADFVMQNHR